MSPALGAGTIGAAPATAAASVTPQQVQIRSQDGRFVLTGICGPDPAEVGGGRGGWEEVQRDRRAAITQWVGAGARSTTVELWLDGWSTQRSVEPDLAVVDGLAPQVPTSETPRVFVVGAPGVASTIPWVIQSVTPSDRLRLPDGKTARVKLTFELLEYRPGDVVVSRPSATKRSIVRNGTPAATKPRTHTVRSGDTLAGIAARYLGKASRWSEIASLNGIRNPNNLRVGTVLKLPA